MSTRVCRSRVTKLCSSALPAFSSRSSWLTGPGPAAQIQLAGQPILAHPVDREHCCRLCAAQWAQHRLLPADEGSAVYAGAEVPTLHAASSALIEHGCSKHGSKPDTHWNEGHGWLWKRLKTDDTAAAVCRGLRTQ